MFQSAADEVHGAEYSLLVIIDGGGAFRVERAWRRRPRMHFDLRLTVALRRARSIGSIARRRRRINEVIGSSPFYPWPLGMRRNAPSASVYSSALLAVNPRACTAPIPRSSRRRSRRT